MDSGTISYNTSLTLIAVIIMFLSTYTAIDFLLRGNVRELDTQVVRFRLFTAAIILGFGTWTMHFIGLQALELRIEVGYDLVLTFFSLILPIVTFFIGFLMLKIGKGSLLSTIWSTIVFLLGVVTMHHLGMNSMIIQGELHQNHFWKIVSLLLGFFFIFLSVRFALSYQKTFVKNKLLSTLFLGTGIITLHFVGSIASFIEITDEMKRSPFIILEGTIVTEFLYFAVLLIFIGNLIHAIREKDKALLEIKKSEQEVILAQTKIKEKDKLTNAAFLAITEGLLVFDQHGRIINWNEKAAIFLSLDPHWLSKMSIEDFNSYSFFTLDMKPMKTEEIPGSVTLKTKEACHNKVVGYRSGEKIYWLSVNSEPLYYDEDFHGAVVTFLDITIEVEQEQRIKESNRLMSTLIDNLQSGIVVVDEKQKISMMNKLFTDIFEIPRELTRMIGKSFIESFPFSFVKDASQIRASMKVTIENKVTMMTQEITLINGEILEANYFPINYEDEQSGYIWEFRIITDQKRMERSLIQARDIAEEASSAKSQFLSQMSHELRTPLNSILGFSQLLLVNQKDPLSLKQKEKVEKIIKSGNHLSNLINEVLDLTKIESNQLTFSPINLNIYDLLEDSVKMILPLAKESNIELSTDWDFDQKQMLYLDKTKMIQVLLNILTNAIKYNRQGGKVIISSQGKDGIFTIMISDTGMGIKREEMDKIFEPFYRSKDMSFEVEGTGIGLAVANYVVSMMGGSISVESQEGIGSTFSISLPISSREEEGDK